MASPTSNRLGPPEVGSSIYGDIIRWVRMGDCVVLHAKGKYSQIYHNCLGQEKAKENSKEEAKKKFS